MEAIKSFKLKTDLYHDFENLEIEPITLYYQKFDENIKSLFPHAMTNCKILKSPKGELIWERVAHKLLEGWGHEFTKAVYSI